MTSKNIKIKVQIAFYCLKMVFFIFQLSLEIFWCADKFCIEPNTDIENIA